MKFSSFILFIFACSFTSFGHAYYFGFAEMQYNQTTRQLETTLVLSTHDLEFALEKEGKLTKALEFMYGDSTTLAHLKEKITADFSVKTDSKKLNLALIGYEVLRNGLINVYLLSESFELGKTLEICFQNLMSEFPEQQNKLTFIEKKQKKSYVFHALEPSQHIILNE